MKHLFVGKLLTTFEISSDSFVICSLGQQAGQVTGDQNKVLIFVHRTSSILVRIVIFAHFKTRRILVEKVTFKQFWAQLHNG